VTERRPLPPWLPPLAGLALGVAAALLLPGARGRIAPLLLVPLVALAWLGIGSAVARLVRPGASLVTRLALGAGALSTLLFLLGLAGGYRTWIAWPLVLVAAGAGAVVLRRERRDAAGGGVAAPRLHALLGLAAGLLLLVVVVPAMDHDAMTYHLALPEAWAVEGRFVHVPTLHYSYLPLGAEQGYVLGRLLLPGGGDAGWTLARGIGLLYGLLFACAAGRLAVRAAGREAGPLATTLLFCVPATLLVSALPYNDAWLGLFLLLALEETMRWAEEPSPRRAALAGLLLGLALAGKPTALLAAPALLAAALALGPRTWLRRGAVPGMLLGCGCALLPWLPWLVKTGLATGNPVYPLAFGWLGGAPEGAAAWDAAAAADNARIAGHGAGPHPLRWLTAPWLLWTDPERFGVLPRVGPHLLVSIPFLGWALASRRSPRARALAVAAVVTYLAWSLTARNARYLLPCLGVALAVTAAGLAVWAARRREGWIVAAVLAAALLGWDAWQATSLFGRLLTPHRFLAGGESVEGYLELRRDPHPASAWAAVHLPEEARVLCLGVTRTLYLERARLVGGPIDPSPLLWLERRTGSNGFPEAVRASGVTHVLANAREMVRLAHERDRYRGREEEAVGLVLWLQGEAERLYWGRGLALYGLPPGGAAPPDEAESR
jgi:hypothetical protein